MAASQHLSLSEQEQTDLSRETKQRQRLAAKIRNPPHISQNRKVALRSGLLVFAKNDPHCSCIVRVRAAKIHKQDFACDRCCSKRVLQGRTDSSPHCTFMVQEASATAQGTGCNAGTRSGTREISQISNLHRRELAKSGELQTLEI